MSNFLHPFGAWVQSLAVATQCQSRRSVCRNLRKLSLVLIAAWLCWSAPAVAQSGRLEIVGTVVGQDGHGLRDAVVQVRAGGKRWTATTDENGYFILRLPHEAWERRARIAASYVGMKREDLPLVAGKQQYQFVLQDNANALGEAIVTGYGTVSLREKTSSITSLKMEEILMPGMTSLEQALEGRVPDMVFMQNSGEAGVTARLRVRGTSTLIGNREPLWVLDGIPLADPVDVTTEQLNDPDYINYIGNAISGLNPQDIERVDVLKDAAATALYGTRAANGVIVVTTKKGEQGPTRISYSSQVKFTRRPRYTDHNINLMNSQERIQFGKDLVDLHYSFPSHMTMVGYEGAYYRYLTGAISYAQFLEEVKRDETVNTDWFGLLTRDTYNHNHTVSMSGGGETGRYYASLGYTKEMGVVRTQDNDRYTASMNLQTNIAEMLSANVRLNASVMKKQYLPSEIDPLGYAYNTTRALPAYNEDGSYYFYQRHAYNIGTDKPANYKYRYNMLNEMSNAEQQHSSDNILAALDLMYRYKYMFDLTLTTSYQRASSHGHTWFGQHSNYVAQLKNGEVEADPIPGAYGKSDLPYGGVYNMNKSVTENFTLRLQANFRHAFGARKQHQTSASLGYEVNMNNTSGFAEQTRGYYKDRGMKYVVMNAEDVQKYPAYASWLANNRPTLTANKTHRLSGYSVLSYSYDSYFSVSLNGRFDASNKFGSRSNEKFLPVWSVSQMTNLREIFFRDNRAITDWRLRASFGKTGNMVDNQTPNLLLRQGSVDTYYGENVSTVFALPNPNLRWEQTDQFNIGMDLSLFDNRLMVGGEFYHKHTRDAFSNVPVSSVNGVTQYTMNSSDLTNRGFSLSLSGYPIKTKNWSWYLSTYYSAVFNKVETKSENEYGLNDYLNGTAIINGQPIGTFYSYTFLGLNPMNGMPYFDDYQDRQHLLMGKSLGQLMEMVMTNSGTREPYLTGSLYSTLRYKQWSLNTNFVYSLGNKIRKFALYKDILDGVSSENNIRKEFVDRWRVPGDERYTQYPSLISPGDPDFTGYRYHWSAQGTEDLRGFKTFGDNYWSMYDNANVRVVSGSYLRLSQVALHYQFTPKQLRKLPISNLALDFSMSNVFTIKSSELDGQDPMQSGFAIATALSLRPSYTFGLRITF